MSRRLDDLTPEQKRALLDSLLKQKSTAAATNVVQPSPPRRDGALRASFGQERIWLVEQLSPGTGVYNVPNPVRMRGELDVAALERALGEIEARHEVLRTTYSTSQRDLLQVIAPPRGFHLPVIDLSGIGGPEQSARLNQLLLEDAGFLFDLTRDRPWRARLIRLSARDHVLSLTVHHIATDNWSWGVFFRELAALYRAYRNGQPSPLAPLAFQYVDYALAQRAMLEGEDSSQLDYWRTQLAGAPELLTLPTDHPRPAVRRFRGKTECFSLSAELVGGLEALCKKERASPFMGFYAAYATLLMRYARQEDISVGTPVAGRTRMETEPLIGFFINTLVLRLDLSGRPSFRQLLGRAREVALGAYANQEVPFERLVQTLRTAPSVSHTPFVQAMLNINTDPLSNVELEGLSLELVPPPPTATQFDLLVSLQRRGAGFDGTIAFDADLFEPESARRAGEHFTQLVKSLVADPDRPVTRASLLSDGERAQWTGWRIDRDEVTLTSLVAHGLTHDPRALAAVSGSDELRYAELDARSTRLAHALRRDGLRPQDRVGLMASRGVEALVALLGILKAGGIYVPLDPTYPPDRLAVIVGDAKPQRVLVERGLEDRLPPGTAKATLLEALDGGSGEGEPLAAPSADAIAYLIYTSGSTGVPKGVAVSHGAAARNVRGTIARLGVRPGERMTQFSSWSFDASIHEIFSALGGGGTLVIVPDEVRSQPELLNGFVSRQRLTLVGFVPSVISMLEPDRVPTVRTVLSAGEACPPELVRRWAGKARLFNLYGPTEAGITATIAECIPSAERPPIGTPLPAMAAYVVDDELQLLPPGVPGELLLGGAALAHGYWGRPDLTAERFLPDPFSTAPGARVYRTGDLVRLRRDGQLEHLGRIDQQVKLRGYRIELGEVEAHLSAHPEVREAVVTVKAIGGDRRLVGYVIPREGSSLREELTSWLRARLPEPMVPSACVVLPSFPRTPNGKVDLAALPLPTEDRTEYVAPRNPREEAILRVFGAVLERSDLGVEDDFFVLGGHSLTAGQVVARLRGELGVDVPLKAIFENTTAAALAEAIAQRLADEREQQVPLRPGLATAETGISFAQERLWFLDRLQAGQSAYNFPVEVSLEGALDAAALERALAAIVERHPVLRTVFPTRDGKPVAKVQDREAFRLETFDLSAVPVERRVEEANARAAAEAVRPFHLAEGPLFRAILFRLGPQSHRLVVAMHHIVTDGASIDLLLGELSALYSAFASGASPSLSPLPFAFADYAAWQRHWMSGARLDAELRHWREKLEGAPRLLDLPLDRPRPAVQSYRGGQYSFRLPPGLSERVRADCKRSGASPFMWFATAFSVLLHRYSRQPEVCLGTPVRGRNRVELESLIGFFANTVVLRADLSGRPTFRALLERVRATTLEALEHDELPFEKLVEALEPERTLSHSPLFQVMFSYLIRRPRALALPGLRATARGVDIPATKFDLALTLEEDGSDLHAGFEFNADLFDLSTVQRLADGFLRLASSALADPEQPVDRLALLGPEQRERMVTGWNATARRFDVPGLLHEAIEAQVDRSPEAVAVELEGAELCYRELDERANALAQALRERGVGPDTFVGVCAERSLEMVVALLAILKAGGAYVPLDPKLPAVRLSGMIADARPSLVLVAPEHRAVLPATVPTLSLESKGTAERVHRLLSPDHLAYAIFTSGSTGKPKLAMNTHRAIVNRLAWMQAQYGLDATDVVLQKTPFSFDVSVWEFFWPLMTGARLVIARPEGHKDPAYLRDVVRERGVTTLHFVPSMLQTFLEQRGLDALSSLRRVLCSGEALPVELARRCLERLPAELHNLYGPTEAAVDVSSFVVPRGALDRLPIGYPISNLRLYVLDPQLEPSPVGVPGEVFIGGVGVGRGYFNRPDLTAERFIPDPFADEPGARLYRTGDLGRLLADGAIEYLGRLDFQVKLRGFRIELGEIETALLRAGAREAVAVIRGAGPDGRLVAYVAPASASFDANEARRTLGEVLPEYMVPERIVVLDRLPLSPNGKIDRGALPEPEALTPEASAFEAPSGPLEELAATTFGAVLDLGRVGRNAHFFEIGGHSLRAVQVVARLTEALGCEVPVRVLFEAPTPRALAPRLQELLTSGRRGPPIERASGAEPAPLSFAQQGFWLLHQLDGSTPLHTVPSAYRVRGALDVDALSRAQNELVRRHAALRTVFRIHERTPAQVVLPFSSRPLPVRDLEPLAPDAREAAVRKAWEDEIRRPFDLAEGPLWRWLLLRLSPDEHVLVWAFHHIVHDAGSEELLVRELHALYSAFVEGRPPNLPEPKVQYTDFARWQRRWLSGPEVSSQLDYWKGALAGVPAALDLPTDLPRPAIYGFQGAQFEFRIPGPLLARIEQLCREQRVTLFMFMLAAYGVFLGRQAGQDDLVIGIPSSGRDREELLGVCGAFLNTLPLRIDLRGAPTFAELLARVRRSLVDGLANQSVPVEEIVSAVQQVRDLSRTPLMHSSLVLLPADLAQLRLGSLRVEPEVVDKRAAKHDVSLMAHVDSDGVRAVFEYNTDLFRAETIQGWSRRFLALLEDLIAQPSCPVAQARLWAPGERERVVSGLNATDRAFDAPRSVHALFEAQVRRTPDAPAVRFREERLTYAELDVRANRLAQALRGRGLGPGGRAAIYVRPALEGIVALYAVLKAGAAYVPLDPDSPPDRLAYILADSGVSLLLTQRDLASEASRYGIEPVLLDEPSTWMDQPASPLQELVHPESLAYVIYTSGTTGEPKGVMVPHRAVTNHNLAVAERFALGPGDRLLQFTPLNYDAAGEEIYPPLLSGAEIIVRGELVPNREFRQLIIDQSLTVLSLPPAYFHEWVADLARQRLALPSSLRLVILGGEKILPETLRLWGQLGGARVPWLNVYGPTETAVTAAMAELRAQEELGKDPVLPIGGPVANVRIYLLDANLDPVLPGQPGEIFIGGAGVAHGYLNRPELTAEKFVPDPFAGQGARLYRTGDLGRHLPDGRIEFVGRVDFQVKLRGHRIELGEIEAALRKHPGVQDAVVVLREDVPDQKRLVAYYVSALQPLPVPEVQGFLRDKVPAHMMPSALVPLLAMPLTPGGKVDRRALPVPDSAAADSEFVEPATEQEKALARIWEELLDVRPVGATANFFDLGGHSLLAIQMLGRAKDELGIEIAMAAFFEQPTVRAMAEPPATAVPRSALVALTPLRDDDPTPVLFCIHPLFGDVQVYYQLAMRLGAGQPCYGLRAPEREGEEPFDTVEQRAAAYLDEIRSLQPSGPYLLAGYGDGGPVALELAQQLELLGEEVGMLMLIDSDLGRIRSDGAVPAEPRALLQQHWETLKHQFSVELERFGRPERWAAVLAEAQVSGGGIADEELERLARTAHAMRASLFRYVPTRFSGPVVHFVAEESRGAEPSLGWKALVPDLRVVPIPGDHRSMLDSPNVEHLAKSVKESLAGVVETGAIE